MTDSIDELLRRTRRYYYDDGLVEIAVALLFLVAGFGLLIFAAIQESTLAGALLMLGLLALAIAGGLFIKRAVEALKQRVTYPRSGYVSYREGEEDRNRWPVLLAALILFIGGLFFLPQELARTSTAIGFLTGAVLFYLGYRLSLRRFYPLGVLSLVAGVSTSYLFADEALGAGLALAIIGAGLFLSGGLVFFAYLRDHPLADESRP